jgi:hypothetical protein
MKVPLQPPGSGRCERSGDVPFTSSGGAGHSGTEFMSEPSSEIRSSRIMGHADRTERIKWLESVSSPRLMGNHEMVAFQLLQRFSIRLKSVLMAGILLHDDTSPVMCACTRLALLSSPTRTGWGLSPSRTKYLPPNEEWGIPSHATAPKPGATAPLWLVATRPPSAAPTVDTYRLFGR